MFASLIVIILGLCHCIKDSNQTFQGFPQLSGPFEALESDTVKYKCKPPALLTNESILLQLVQRDQILDEKTSVSGETGNFTLKVKPSHEGYLKCVARVRNDSNIEHSVSSAQYLKVFDATEVFEGAMTNLLCSHNDATNVSYKWYLNGQLIPMSPSAKELSRQSTTSKDNGSYVCVATNRFNKKEYRTNSSEVIIRIKVRVSKPDIYFTVIKEDAHNYSAMVTCQSTYGTPYITFSLYNEEKLFANKTGEDRNVTFKVSVILGRNMGWFHCQASNGDRIVHSESLALRVVPVSGHVTVRFDSHLGKNYAVDSVTLFCEAENGTHPRYQWFLNNTLLDNKGRFYSVENQPPEQSLLLLSVGRSSVGTYHCNVSDSFDNTTAIGSKKLYLDEKVWNRLPDALVATVFACFTVLILLVSICCWVGVLFRRRRYGKTSLMGLEMQRTVAAYEGVLDVSQYVEDADEMTPPSGEEFDQASEASLDEWPDISAEKSFHGEPAEFP
uniref:platelet endothelial cell adhesion molecule isoform X2 n=1 Tax=Monopterus albus TaxID=43700 RepID=UPI0009B4EA47|nr:platelet endothelial cell adhesion molecule-like isoform X2 [Monopterus albus]